MGTDIHAFVEVDYSRNEPPFGENAEVRPFNCGELFIWRNYDLFDALGHGRSFHFSPKETEKRALYPPRGLPPRVSFLVLNRFFHVVDERGENRDREPALRTISNKEADTWLAQGWSFLGEPVKLWRGHGEESLRCVSHPNWHSVSWLTLKEVYAALEHFGLRIEGLSPEVRVMLTVMRQFEEELGSGRTRLVFWFDN